MKYIDVYVMYVQNYGRSIEYLEDCLRKEKAAAFFGEVRKNPNLKGLDVSSFLIMPVQRIPRSTLSL